MDLGVRLFDLVQQNNGVRGLPQPSGQCAVGVRADIPLWRAEQLIGRLRLAELGHVQRQQLAFQFKGQPLGEVGLAGSGRPSEQEHTHRFVALRQRQPAADLRGEVLADRVLADHLCLQVSRQRLGIDHLGFLRAGHHRFQRGAIGQPVQYHP